MSLDLSKCAAFANGEVDMKETLSNVASAVRAYNEAHRHDQLQITAAVNQVFDKYKGVFLNSKALATFVCGVLQPKGLEGTILVTKRVGEYVAANSKEGGPFVIRKARGVARLADLSEKDLKSSPAPVTPPILA